jgi:hypothetical protein
VIKTATKFAVSFVLAVLSVLVFSAPVLAQSSSATKVSGMTDDPNIVYIMPKLDQRVKNPMGVRCKSVRYYASYGDSLWSIFSSTVSDASKYVILKVVRVPFESNPDTAAFWFDYIEKEYVVPLDGPPAMPVEAPRSK